MDIRERRKKARMTQMELAQRTGIDRSRLSQAECGYRELRLDELELISRAIAAEVQLRVKELTA